MDPWMQHDRGKSFAHRLGNWLAHDYVKKHSTEEILKEPVRNIAQMMYDDIGEGLEYYRDKWPDHYPCIQEQAEFLAGGKEALLDCYEAFIIKHIGKPLEKYKKVSVCDFGTPGVTISASDRYDTPKERWLKMFQNSGIEYIDNKDILYEEDQQIRPDFCLTTTVQPDYYLPQFQCYFMLSNCVRDFFEKVHEKIGECALIIAFGTPSDKDMYFLSEEAKQKWESYEQKGIGDIK